MLSRTRISLLLSSVLLLAGCSGVFKSRWDNFTAYYNTFYNARTIVDRHETALSRQKTSINPERPIRLWESPAKSGTAELEKAVTKGATVLLNHPNSKWADDALLIIGKSYFYQSQFFAAEQKFDEALATSKDISVLQQAVYWKGRIYLEMRRFREGKEFIQRRMAESGLRWTADGQAELSSIQVQILVEETNYEAAQKELLAVVNRIPDPIIRGKAFFLLGQLSERLKEPLAARNAYGKVNNARLDYDLRFKAKLRLAEIERETGRYGNALALYKAMVRDDKNFESISDLNYEVGRTLQKMGRSDDALEMYRKVLYNAVKPPTLPTKAKTYYALGEMARYQTGNYRIAAAWFDSAAKSAPDLSKLPEGFNAADLSRSFGEYARLNKEIKLLDSLLWLGSLSQDKLDSVIEVLRKQKIAAMQETLKKQQAAANTAIIIAAPTSDSETYSAQNGFLNHKNPELVARGMQQFRAVWGSRPLVDNWRRSEAALRQVSAQIQPDQVSGAAGTQLVQSAGPNTNDKLTIDLKGIPFTQSAQDSTRQKLSGLHYEMGNLFFLQLNLPDSAEARYRRVLDKYPGSFAESGSLYVLAEVLSASGKETEAREMATRLVVRYPETDLAARAALRFKFAFEKKEETPSDSAARAFPDVVKVLEEKPARQADPDVRSFSGAFPNSVYSAEILWLLGQKYAEEARSDTAFARLTLKNLVEKEQFEKDIVLWKSRKDSAKTVFARKDTLSKKDSTYWLQIMDYRIDPPVAAFQYNGALWDSTRAIFTLFASRFPKHGKTPLASAILNELRIPEPVVEGAAKNENPDQKSAPVPKTPVLDLLNAKKPAFWIKNKPKTARLVLSVDVGVDGKPTKVEIGPNDAIEKTFTELFLAFLKTELQFSPASAPFKVEIPVSW